MFVSAADQPLNEQETRFALAVVELQVISGGKPEFWGRVETPVTSQLCYQHFNWPLGSRHSAFFCRSLVELTTNIREVSKCHAIAKRLSVMTCADKHPNFVSTLLTVFRHLSSIVSQKIL